MNPYSTPRAFVVRVQSVEDPAPNAPEWYVCTAQEVVESDLEPVRTLGRQGTSGEDGREPYQAVTEAMGSVLPEPDEDGPAPELAPAELWLVCQINFGHGEYPVNTALIRAETVFAWTDEKHEGVWESGDMAALMDVARADGVRDCDVDESNVNFANVERLMGTREQHENALRDLIGRLDGLSHTSDDDFYDYWPSGVRAAQAWANVLGGPWPQMVEDRVRAILSDEELKTLRTDEGKV
jgi:hypothetical protein